MEPVDDQRTKQETVTRLAQVFQRAGGGDRDPRGGPPHFLEATSCLTEPSAGRRSPGLPHRGDEVSKKAGRGSGSCAGARR